MTRPASSGQGEPDTYLFSPPERRALLAGWRKSQVIVVGSGLAFATVVVRCLPSIAGIILALTVAAASLGAVAVPIGGSTTDEWMPDLWRYAFKTATGSLRTLSGTPESGAILTLGSLFDRPGIEAAPSATSGPDACVAGSCGQPVGAGPYRIDGSGRRGERAPSERRVSRSEWNAGPYRRAGRITKLLSRHPLQGLELMRVVPEERGILSERHVGMVHDSQEQTYSVALGVQSRGFLLAAPEEQSRRVGAWAQALSSLAREGTPVCRVQWLVRSLPGDPGELYSYYREYGTGLGNPRLFRESSDQAVSYEELLSSCGARARCQEANIVLTVRSRSRGYHRKGCYPELEAANVLVGELVALTRRLQDAGVDAGDVLGVEELMACFAGTTSGRTGDAARAASGARIGSADPSRWAWPAAVEEHWDCVHVDSAWYSTYWVAQWPRVPVSSEFLAPLMLDAEDRRCMAVVMEPVSPAEAVRQVEQFRTTQVADEELRRTGGFIRTARARREHESLLRREQELADGHGQFRYSGYCAVEAGDRDALADARSRMEQAAGQARLELRLLYGRQGAALAYTLPIGRGLSR